ncbi:MAG: WD40 repeat domain-containing protein [bacterium]|nr:WD40 repeat domain-containing protein [bacterium]
MGLLIGLLVVACRDKCTDCDEPGRFEPPYAVVASAVGGELAFFDLRDLSVVADGYQQGWATACELQSIANRLITIDSESGGLAIYELPEIEAVDNTIIAGTPIDLKLDHAQLSAHVITRSGVYYRIPFSTMVGDTTDTGSLPRRLAFRPPADHESWIACVGDNSVRVVRMQGFFESRRIDFNGACTDVCFSPGGDSVFCAVPDEDRIYVLHSEDGIALDTLTVASTVVDLAISRDGRYLAAADSVSGNVRIWDLLAGREGSLRCGTSAVRIRYSNVRHAFLVVCPEQNWVMAVNPVLDSLAVTDTLVVAASPQCISLRE